MNMGFKCRLITSLWEISHSDLSNCKEFFLQPTTAWRLEPMIVKEQDSSCVVLCQPFPAAVFVICSWTSVALFFSPPSKWNAAESCSFRLFHPFPCRQCSSLACERVFLKLPPSCCRFTETAFQCKFHTWNPPRALCPFNWWIIN